MRPLTLTIVVAALAMGECAWAEDPQFPTTNPQPKNELGEPDVGPVRSAKKLMGAAVKKLDKPFGRIEDIALDIGQGEVGFVFVMPERRGAATPESLSVPARLLDFSKADDAISLGSAIEASDAPKIEPSPADKSMVVLFSALKDHPVVDANGKQLGHVVDMALATQSGLIGYAVVTLNDQPANRLYPIPLTAFVAPREAKSWILELPADVVAQTPAFHESEWPEVIPRAWIEYVRVRYGRSHSGGVGTELHGNDQ